MKTQSMRILTLSLTLAALFGLNSLALAQGTMMGNTGSMMGGSGYGSMMGLTPEKQAETQKMYTEFFASTSSVRQQLTSKQYELNAIIYGSNPDDKKVQALTKEISDLRAKLFEARVGFQKQLVKEGLPVMGGMSMMGGMSTMGGMDCSVAGMGF